MKKAFSLLITAFFIVHAIHAGAAGAGKEEQQNETGKIVTLVKEAATLIKEKGEKAFPELRAKGSKWKQGETYIFVLNPDGTMLVHADPEMENKNQLGLKDINGKPIIKGLLNAATSLPDKPEGWYHYEWPVPGGLLPRWKSSYVQLVQAPSGKKYIVGSGMYTDQMDREFVVDMVHDAVGQVQKDKAAAFKLFRDRTGPFIAKDAYIFVVDPKGVELVNPGFQNLEGRNLLDLKDTHGKFLVKEMLKTAETKGSGWVEYMWPKPGESVSTRKSTFVSKAGTGSDWLLVACGVYLADAPKEAAAAPKITAPELVNFVSEAATELQKRGEKAYPDFRKKDSKWFKDDTYLFVWTLDGKRVFHAADPTIEGEKVNGTKDVLGRPYGSMFLETAASTSGEGWVHYMYPEPGNIFPAWKSSFVKKVTFPDGKKYLVGSGVYNMQLDKTLVEDVVNRAAALIEKQGKHAFSQLRDKTGPYYFMDTYVFVTKPDGTELVNASQPSLEGKNILNEKDVKGKLLVKEYLDAAMKNGKAWVNYYWYKPGENTPTRKQAFVRKVTSGKEVYVVGSGYYPVK